MIKPVFYAFVTAAVLYGMIARYCDFKRGMGWDTTNCSRDCR